MASVDTLTDHRLAGIQAAARYLGRPRQPNWVRALAWLLGAEVTSCTAR